MEGRIQVPTLNEGQELTIGKQLVIMDKFLRWGPFLENHAVEIYRVRAKSSRQGDNEFHIRTLRKIPLASKRLLHVAVQELNTLKAFRQCGGHPNIVSLVDGAFYPSPSESSDSDPLERYDIYYLFEDEEIGTLADFLSQHRKQNGTISEQELLELLLPICEAIAFLHTFRPPLLHRNIRLSNVVQTSGSTLKLSGFLGIAFELPPGKMTAEDKRAIIEDLACYTEPRYRAPEVLYPTSRIGINTKSGVLMFVAAFGKSPFHLSDPMNIVDVKYSFPRLENPYILQLIDSLLRKSPKSRPDIFEVIATIKSMAKGFRTFKDFDHSTRDLEAVFGDKKPPFQVPRRSYMWYDLKKPRTGIPNAPPAASMLLPPIEDENSPGISVASHAPPEHNANVLERDMNKPEGKGMTEAPQDTLPADNALYLDGVALLPERPPPSVESSPASSPRSTTPQPDEETPTTPNHGASSPVLSENTSPLADSGYQERGVLTNRGEQPNRVPSPPLHPSPPRRGLTNTPTLLYQLPIQADPDDLDDSINDAEQTSGSSTPTRRGETKGDQENEGEAGWNSDQELFHTPQESLDQSSLNSSSILGDIGSFITHISEDPFRINGSFCDVFEGMHSTEGRVALKRPRIGGTRDDEGVIRGFEREAMAWRMLRHRHILKFLGTFKRNQHLYFVSPFIANGTLIEYIARHPLVNRVRLLSETADALSYLHRNGIVHGDIKGTNILIDDHVHCLLCDFGLTKMVQTEQTSASMRGVGTFRWQSPELWLDASKSFSSDTYAFAITIAEVLAGEAPFASLKNDTAVMFAVLNANQRPPKEPPESPSGISYKTAWEVAEACWAKLPEERITMAVAFERLRADPVIHCPDCL
ncbi:hypothetical protein FRC01_001137 [Tulasnella sp. 417]|nr:hypothetical protein FRC01_001137 [Tulasnella sp. 417]